MKNKIIYGLLGLSLGYSGIIPFTPVRNAHSAKQETRTLEQAVAWEELDKGLHLTEITTEQKPKYGDGKITVLRINPENYSIELLSATEHGREERTAKKWAEEFGLVAAINAGMFEEDHLSNVGFMKNFDHTNNPTPKKGYNAILAFNPKDDKHPAVKIIDPKCDKKTEILGYESVSQSIRMISCKQDNRWAKQDKMWSQAAIGVDKEGNLLFIHSRSPYTTHDFIDHILNAQIGIYNMMYVEGGPEASLYINASGKKLELIGSYETDFVENDDNEEFWEIPNVIGIKKK